MEWKQIRAHYERAFGAARKRGMTQAKVAKAGGLAGQNAVSKVLHYPDTSLGPQVVTLVKAVEGLGLRVSEFFAQIEQRTPHPDLHRDNLLVSLPAGADDEKVAEVERAIGRSFLQALRLAQAREETPMVKRRPRKKDGK